TGVPTMFDRDNWPGIVMLGLCAVLAIALLIEIFTDVTFEYTGPRWLAVAISIFGIVLIGIMSWRAWGGRMRRWRGGGSGGPVGWPQNDVPGRQMNWPRRKGSGDTSADPKTTTPPDDTTEQPPR
ncbi:MAG: hypothetical protein ACRDHN_05755, partial [Thermomicrobiales bacterium]